MSTRITTPDAPSHRPKHLHARPDLPVRPQPCGCGHSKDWKDDGIAGGMSDDRNNVQTGAGG